MPAYTSFVTIVKWQFRAIRQITFYVICWNQIKSNQVRCFCRYSISQPGPGRSEWSGDVGRSQPAAGAVRSLLSGRCQLHCRRQPRGLHPRLYRGHRRRLHRHLSRQWCGMRGRLQPFMSWRRSNQPGPPAALSAALLPAADGNLWHNGHRRVQGHESPTGGRLSGGLQHRHPVHGSA